VYLAWLDTLTPVKVVLKDGQFTPAEVSVTMGDMIQLIIDNQDRTEYQLTSEGLGSHLIAPRSTFDLAWEAQAEPGTLTVDLLDDMGTVATLSIFVQSSD
jgi:hypothetical protein